MPLHKTRVSFKFFDTAIKGISVTWWRAWTDHSCMIRGVTVQKVGRDRVQGWHRLLHPAPTLPKEWLQTYSWSSKTQCYLLLWLPKPQFNVSFLQFTLFFNTAGGKTYSLWGLSVLPMPKGWGWRYQQVMENVSFSLLQHCLFHLQGDWLILTANAPETQESTAVKSWVRAPHYNLNLNC